MMLKRQAVIFLCAALSISFLLSACAAKDEDVLIGTRVEAAHMSFILPEGWDYEEIEGMLIYASTDRPRNDVHGAVALYPPSRDVDLYWMDGPYLLNASYFYELRAMYRADYKAGMTLDEWVEARLYNMPVELYHIAHERLSHDVHVMHREDTLGTMPDQVSYMRITSDLAVTLYNSDVSKLTQEEQALLVKIIESVQPLENE